MTLTPSKRKQRYGARTILVALPFVILGPLFLISVNPASPHNRLMILGGMSSVGEIVGGVLLLVAMFIVLAIVIGVAALGIGQVLRALFRAADWS